MISDGTALVNEDRVKRGLSIKLLLSSPLCGERAGFKRVSGLRSKPVPKWGSGTRADTEFRSWERLGSAA